MSSHLSETKASPGLLRAFWRDERLHRSRIAHGVTKGSLGDMRDEANRRRALDLAGLAKAPHYRARQVHGIRILHVRPGNRPPEGEEADGLITSEEGACLSVFVADCMPIFLWEPSARLLGVFHSGWKGTALGMPRAAAAAMADAFSTSPDRFFAVIGPHIGPCCYRVGEDVAGKFRAESVERRGEGRYLDLSREAVSQLMESGMSRERIFASPECTHCSPDLFSFRRDKEGRAMLAFASLGGAS